MATPKVATITATVICLNSVMREVNDAIMYFDANHRITNIGCWLRALVGATPLVWFCTFPMNY